MDGLWIGLISLGITGLFLLGVPIFLVISFWVIGVSLVIDFTLANVGVTLYEGLNFYGLLALPLFILTGDLINAAGIAKRLSDFAYACLGFMRGGLGMASLGACGMFAAISGSNSATTATIGSIMHPEMKKGNYNEEFAAATVAAGGVVGIIIPPSIIFIVYGFMMNLPIGELFMAGMIPGALMVFAMMATCYIVSWRNGWGDLIKFSPTRIVKTGGKAWLGFMAMGIVLLGLYTGSFSPTEAAGVTTGFCLIAGLLVTRKFGIKDLPKIMMRSGQITGMLAPLIAVSVVMQQVLSLLGTKAFLTGLITSLGGFYPILFACMAIVFVVGAVLESLPVTVILAPILAPIAASIGVDPIQFAVVFLVGASIGFITPPYGLNLYVASGMTGIPYLRIVKHVVPYLIALILTWFAIALIPGISLWILS
ncbi:TRAP transporter large permease [Marinobacterium rhizophilum]|uniref:TRAP transporter large permease protein n=1 Tax=Marinobacterium rhizophilum TaxID=420402 RepID=A0ABY5HKT9_9GAMM|nr:TRAP transporter large permease [Marinobacterium rhizophilum]UTW11852.1 TRAP transporter large permease [Marinobacterium rhizophilum]